MNGPRLPWWVRAANATWRVVEPRRTADEGALSVDALLAHAERAVPDGSFVLDPSAGWGVREPLRRLIADLVERGQLSLFGRLGFVGELRGALENRRRIAATLAANPEIAAQPVAPPIVIAGLPRTGTTLLHGLLAQVSALRAPRLWECLHPVPPPAEVSELSRVQEVERGLRITHAIAPGVRAVHAMEASAPEECVFLLRHSVASTLYHLQADVPGYVAWLLATGQAPVYREHRRMLQLLQWRRAPRTWVLKSPHHLLFLDDLLAVYPHATIVRTHRDPRVVAASGCSLYEHVRTAHLLAVDPSEVAEAWLGLWGGAQRRADRSRAVRQRQVIDVDYDALIKAPAKVTRHILEASGVPVDRDHDARVHDWLAAHRAGRHGAHRYDPDRYGLSDAVLARAGLTA